MPRLSKIGAAALAAFGWTGLSTVSASYLVVAGGGGGGGYRGGGGGAGGYRTGSASLSPTQSYTVTVGAGGAGATYASASRGSSGADSVFSSITSTGGGGGGDWNTQFVGGSGGSGGGTTGNPSTQGTTPGLGNTPSTSPSQGNNGGLGATDSATYAIGGGGGGSSATGASASGSVGGNGGAGTANSISGTSVTYAGGGGGGGLGTVAGSGGSGGGGAGSLTGSGTNGTANLGGGGGGDGNNSGNSGGSGGSGIVIISYPAPQKFGGGIVTTSGSNVIHTFNTSGTLTPLSSLTASYLIVAGGASGASRIGGGGGAGGLLTGSGLTIDTNSNYVVTVGAGGASVASTPGTNGNNGSNSSFSAYATTAVGGGGGGAYITATSQNGIAGGSGGGASSYNNSTTGGSGTSGQGNAGGGGVTLILAGSGGGGAGAVGSNASAVNNGGGGGIGVASSISGTSTYYAGGGGGSATATPGAGGTGGGGAGATNQDNATAGTVNTGGGGGGARNGTDTTNVFSGAGGSGVVIISYAGSTQQMAGGTVTISGGNVIHTFTSSGYLTPIKLVNNSLRFRKANNAYLSRTPTVAGNRTTWTMSFWIKRGQLTADQVMFACGGSGNDNICYFESANQTIQWFNRTSTAKDGIIITSQVFRDPSAWYHFVFVWNSGNATASNRMQMYVNGVQVTAFSSTTNPSLNLNSAWNNTVNHQIMSDNGAPSATTDGELTEVNFVDGQALTASSFGTFNSYGVWQPITYGGSYGTNGFYLPFTNKTSTTTLGYDFSPNGNNWTTNNISLTAGSTYDSMTDVPTLTSATAANYATLNPIAPGDYFTSGQTAFALTNGNLSYGSTGRNSFGLMAFSSGKFYWEMVNTSNTTAATALFGVVNAGVARASVYGCYYNAVNGNKGLGLLNSGASETAYGSSWTDNDVIGVAVNMDAATPTVTFYKNNTSQGAISVSSFVGQAVMVWIQNGGNTNNMSGYVNFGQQPFVYSLPSGYVALNTYNL